MSAPQGPSSSTGLDGQLRGHPRGHSRLFALSQVQPSAPALPSGCPLADLRTPGSRAQGPGSASRPHRSHSVALGHTREFIERLWRHSGSPLLKRLTNVLTLLTRGAGLYRPQTSLARLGGRLRNWGRLSVAKLLLEDLPSPAWASPSPPPPLHPTLGLWSRETQNWPQSQELHPKCTSPNFPRPSLAIGHLNPADHWRPRPPQMNPAGQELARDEGPPEPQHEAPERGTPWVG